MEDSERVEAAGVGIAAENRERVRRLLHEINNSLGAVRGYCELASLKGEGGDALDQRMRSAVETIEKITPMLRELRSLVVGLEPERSDP